MPPRWICILILLFWVLTNGWLLWGDLLPFWGASEAPPLVMDIDDEIKLQRNVKAGWSVFVDDDDPKRPSYDAYTQVEHQDKDLYEISFELRPKPDTAGGSRKQKDRLFKAERMVSHCQVTGDGQLRSLMALVEVEVKGIKVVATFTGDARGGEFSGHYRIATNNMIVSDSDLDPVPVPRHGAVLMPVHPLQRLPGLRPGQSWTVPELDPLVGFPFTQMRVVRLRARVLPEPETIPWKGRDVACLVVVSGGDDQEVRTWVERDSGMVLRQQTSFGGQKWVLQRENK
jgi:hypothetical protein